MLDNEAFNQYLYEEPKVETKEPQEEKKRAAPLEKLTLEKFIIELNNYEKVRPLDYEFCKVLRVFFGFYYKYAENLNPTIVKHLKLSELDEIFDLSSLIRL